MFGRRKREEAAAAEAAREDERRALFARLAERPEHICPFLGLEADRTGYVEGVSADHRCFAFGDPAPISAEQQTRVCQERGYGNCPRYLRGVLVIPTEELEALRRPRPAVEQPLAPPPGAPSARRRRRSALIGVGLFVLLIAAGGLGVVTLLGRNNGVAVEPTSSPAQTAVATPSTQPTGSPEPTPSTVSSATPTPTPTPVVLPSAGETIPPLPTPPPDSSPVGWIVVVTRGDFPVVRIGEDGEPGEDATAIFSRVSAAPVDRLEIGGTRYWMTLAGEYSQLAYVRGLSGDFAIFETWEAPDDSVGFLRLPDDER